MQRLLEKVGWIERVDHGIYKGSAQDEGRKAQNAWKVDYKQY